MKIIDYRLVQKILVLATLIAKLAQAILALLNMASNYQNIASCRHGFTRALAFKI